MYGIIDCDNCYVSCERVFRPDLDGKPVVVLSNNDGWVGMPVSIGIAPNKTLAKVASHFAKKYPGYNHCCLIDTEEKREKALRLYPVEDVWGIGRRYAARLASYGVMTADNPIQHDLFDIKPEQYDKLKSLDDVLDRINRLYGTETLVVGSQQYTQKEGKGKADVFANAIKHDFRSKNPTTRWSDVIKLK